jgi:ubiquinone/menaquinone biosynthesis C-methylase UbiE
MGIGKKLTAAYFDLVYNPAYDFTTAQTISYRRLQRECIDKFEFKPNVRLLCIGVGTGNEILPILERNRQVEIVGIDTSPRALNRAYCKAARQGKEVKLLRMDAAKLEFEDESFDKAFCFHVMEFVADTRRVTEEILRVLKRGGQFVLTYPSAREGLGLGINMLKESLHQDSSSFKAFFKFFPKFAAGVVYLPLLFRGNRRSYSPLELEAMFAELNLADFHLEEDAIYQDFIVYGIK